MKKFCDDHEWAGEPGQSCPECDALHQAEFRYHGTTHGPRQNCAAPVINNIPKTVDWNGIQVLKNDMLTGRTMVVSPEVFEMLTETPEQRQAKARALVEKADQLMALCDTLIKRPTV